MPLISFRSPAVVLLPLAVLAGMLGGCDRQSPDAAQPQSATREGAKAPVGDAQGSETAFNGTLDIASRGSALPDFTLSDPDGRKLRTLDLKGRPLLINLWATWCGPCVLEMPMLDGLAKKLDGKLRVVTVSQDSGQADKVKAFFSTKKFARLEPWLDPQNDLGFHYNTGLLPTTVLYDAQGREVWRMIGAHDWSSARTEALLADTVGQ